MNYLQKSVECFFLTVLFVWLPYCIRSSFGKLSWLDGTEIALGQYHKSQVNDGKIPHLSTNAVFTEIKFLKKNSLRLYGSDSSEEDGENSLASAKCPTSVRSCLCRSYARGVLVECDKLRGKNEFVDAFAQLRSYTMEATRFKNLNFELSNSDFDPLQMISLEFAESHVVIRGATGTFSFASLPDTKKPLQSIYFVQTKLDLGNTTLAKTPFKLTSLHFNDVEFENYQPGWFEGLQVEQLVIRNSQSIWPEIAKNLIGLENFTYSMCRLRNITKKMLPENTTQIRTLDFSSNDLSWISEDFFVGIPALEEILLKANKFQSLDQKVFKSVWGSMRLLDVDGNLYLDCQGVEWVLEKIRNGERSKIRGTCLDENGLELNLQSESTAITDKNMLIN